MINDTAEKSGELCTWEEGRERETDSLYSSSLYSSSLYSTYLYSTSLTFTSLYSTSLLTCQGIMSNLLARLLKNWTAVGFHLDSLINNENLDFKESKMKGLRQRKLKMISRSTWRSWRSSQRTWRRSSTLQTNTKGTKKYNDSIAPILFQGLSQPRPLLTIICWNSLLGGEKMIYKH